MSKYFNDPCSLVRARDVLSDPGNFRQLDAISDYPAGAKEMLLCGRKKDETRGWELLPGYSRVNAVMGYQLQEKQLAMVAQMPGLQRLGLLNSKVDDFSALAAAKKLELVIIEDATSLSTLSSFSQFRGLRALGILDAKRLNDLSGLESIPQLEELAIQCGIWNPLKVRTFQPLASLKKLKSLSLHAESEDGSLEPLRHLSALKELSLNLECSYSEMAKLAAFLPERICPYFAEPYATANTCRKDKTHTTIVPANGWPKFCKDCHPAKLDEYLAEFTHIRDDSRRRKAW